MTHKPALFSPIKVGAMALKHRVVMAPLTRGRATNPELAPTPDIVEFYAQRAATPGTLLIAEATYVSERGAGVANLPGIWSQVQIEAWRLVTKAVHARGSAIVVQLWALGRCGSRKWLAERGFDLVGASSVPELTGEALEYSGLTVDPDEIGVVPRELSTEEVRQYVRDFAQAAINAREAGFDGVEIHAANGYLLDQFLSEETNKRTDEYGGSVANRARLTLEVIDAVSAAIGADRTGLRISPFGVLSRDDPGAVEQHAHILAILERRARDGDPLAYVHTIEHCEHGRSAATGAHIIIRRATDFVGTIWRGAWIRTQGFDRESALEIADTDPRVLVGFGRGFIANPDLVKRLRRNLPWNELDESTYYTGGAHGLTDYPEYEG